ncbi:hypothetical protein BDN71DRAFT_1446111, partial [Pleurotus eryngii]
MWGIIAREDDPRTVHEYVVPSAPRTTFPKRYKPNPRELRSSSMFVKVLSVRSGDSGLRGVLITTYGVLILPAILLRRRQHEPPSHFWFVRKQLATDGCLLFCIEFFCTVFRPCVVVNAFLIRNDSGIVNNTGQNGLKHRRVFVKRRCNLGGVLMHEMLRMIDPCHIPV